MNAIKDEIFLLRLIYFCSICFLFEFYDSNDSVVAQLIRYAMIVGSIGWSLHVLTFIEHCIYLRRLSIGVLKKHDVTNTQIMTSDSLSGLNTVI